MATVKKGVLIKSGSWGKHFRWWSKRQFWSKHRKAEQKAIRHEEKTA